MSPRRSAIAKRPWWKTPSIAAAALIVGIALGVAVGRSSKSSNDASSVAPAQSASASASAAPASPAPVVVKSVVLQVSGNAAKTTKNFVVAADWSVAYSYDCTSVGKASSFSVIEHGGDGVPLPIVNVTGTKGAKVAYQRNDGGERALEIDSGCDWTLTVTSGDAG